MKGKETRCERMQMGRDQNTVQVSGGKKNNNKAPFPWFALNLWQAENEPQTLKTAKKENNFGA